MADTTPSEPQRLHDLWFEDGNLVIQAGNRQFRVYRGILAARSPVFQDMLSFPQPVDSELVDGCPIVRIPDSAMEATVFLKAIFLPDSFRPYPAETTYDILAGCLRLGHKYGVDSLRRQALIHLSSYHPTSLSTWDHPDFVDDAHLSFSPISWAYPRDLSYNMSVVELAREIDAPWVLPITFYRLSNALSTGRLGREIFVGTVYNGVTTSLSEQDQVSFLKGHNIQNHSAADVLRFLSHPQEIEDCDAPTECFMERIRVLDELREGIQKNSCVALNIWDAEDWERLEDLCSSCHEVLRETHANARQAFWDKLPEMYGLPSWVELEKLKVTAIGDRWLC
ncbi:hypothetical protein C8R43DRAFT_1067909 [Mycena crocata]|nr:hypothetical protein C8R43DRAFT_1067909 [Mycena crocata]